MTTQKHQRSDDFNPNLELGAVRSSGREYVKPVDYEHPYPSMARFAGLLALRYDANRTRHAYYRQVRLIHEHFACDPATLTEADLRDYFLHVKLKKHWLPKTIRQARAAARLFFGDLLEQADWKIFSQIRAKDHDTLPAVLTRPQVRDLLAHVRLRRYRTPLKLIYACGLRLSECLGLTIHDVRSSKRNEPGRMEGSYPEAVQDRSAGLNRPGQGGFPAASSPPGALDPLPTALGDSPGASGHVPCSSDPQPSTSFPNNTSAIGAAPLTLTGLVQPRA